MKKFSNLKAALLMAILLVTLFGGSYAGADTGDRGISFYTDYTSIGISAGQEVELSVTIEDTGTVPEDVDLAIDAPEGWKAALTAWATKDAEIKSVHLEPDTDPKKLTLKVTPASEAAEGTYSITITATSRDQQITHSIDIAVDILAGGTSSATEKDVELSVNYPSLEGEPGDTLEYRVTIKNNSEEEKTFEFAAEVPQYFNVSFSPSTDRSKKVTALPVDANSSENVLVSVQIGALVEEGDYNVTFHTVSGEISDSIQFEAVVKGRHHMYLATTRETLNAKATAGKETHISLIVVNDGSAPLNDITLTATRQPDDWEVKFTPDTIDYLEPGPNGWFEVDMTVRPKSKAIAGDYIVEIRARESESPNAVAEFRITVESSSSWLWIAVVIVVAVLAGLLATFLLLRRR